MVVPNSWSARSPALLTHEEPQPWPPEPGPNTRDRFLVRYAATSLRGSLIELLAAFRPNGEARALEDDVQGDTDLQPDPDSQLR